MDRRKVEFDIVVKTYVDILCKRVSVIICRAIYGGIPEATFGGFNGAMGATYIMISKVVYKIFMEVISRFSSEI